MSVRQADPHAGALPERALDGYRAAVVVRDPACDGEAESAAARCGRSTTHEFAHRAGDLHAFDAPRGAASVWSVAAAPRLSFKNDRRDANALVPPVVIMTSAGLVSQPASLMLFPLV